MEGKHRHTADRCADKYKYNVVLFRIVCKAGLGCLFCCSFKDASNLCWTLCFKTVIKAMNRGSLTLNTHHRFET